MGKDVGTFCSASQELFVPFPRMTALPRGDSGRPTPDNRSMTEIMPQDARAEAAYARFQELVADLAMSQDAAQAYAYEFGVGSKEMSKKAVKQWFARQQIPAYAVFNLAAAMGIDVAWLGGSDRISKERAIHKGGYYYREMERIARLRAELTAKKPRQRA